MTYSALIAALQRRGQFRINPGLERTRAVLGVLGNPHAALKCIHIAGTNGKGSVAACLESVLRHAGFRTGLYTSPHLMDVRERIQVDREPVTEAHFIRAAESVVAAERKTRVSLTYFEFLTVMAYRIFADSSVDAAVIETGMGGRWDATNILEKPELTLITSIGLDHTRWLGGTLNAISREKAGIIKPGVPVLSGARGAAAKVIKGRARNQKALYRVIDVDFSVHPSAVDGRHGRQTLGYRGWTGDRSVRLGLLGSYQADNAAVTLAALDTLRERGWNIPLSAEREGLLHVNWPGRFQIKHLQNRLLLLDGAHNPPAMQHLVESLKESPWRNRRKTFVFSAYRDKDVKAMLQLIEPHADKLFVCTMPGRRALPARHIAALLPEKKAIVEADPVHALRRAEAESDADALIVGTGSFSLVAILMKSIATRRLATSQLSRERHLCLQ